MTQLSLFSREQLAGMRDHTRARNYSAERDAFRREHERRRNHGKAQRHARRIYEQFQRSCPEPSSVPLSPATSATTPLRPRAAPARPLG